MCHTTIRMRTHDPLFKHMDFQVEIFLQELLSGIPVMIFL